MKLKYVYTGSWFPRTKLHLREIYNFLKYQRTALIDEKPRLAKLAQSMGFTKVEYRGGTFDTVLADSDGLQIEYDEDGLLLLKAPVTHWPKDNEQLEKFYQEKLTAFLHLLFSKGAPSLEKVRTGTRVRPTIAVATHISAKELEEFFAQAGDVCHHSVRGKELTVHFGEKIILIVTGQPDSELVSYLARAYMFFREYEAYLYRFMLVDRKIWDKINEIREHKTIKGKDLPQVRDQLILFKRDVSVIKLRLSQMDNYFQEREADIAAKKLREKMQVYQAYRFEKMASIHEYMVELMETTEKYVDDAVNLLELLYQENQQKEIGTLQVIFLVGTVANIFVLGSMANFDIDAFVVFGGFSVLISFGIYWIWRAVFKRIRLNKASSLLERPMRDDEL